MIGIYFITNKVTGKRYIGQSLHMKERSSQHRNELRNNRHFNRYLQSAWNKYGVESFDVEIIEECSSDVLSSREEYWLCKYEPNVYNLGNTGIGGHLSEETKQLIRKSSKRGDENPARRPEIKLKILLNRSDYVHSEETKRKIAESLKGRSNPFTKEHILSLRAASNNKVKVNQLTLAGEFIRC